MEEWLFEVKVKFEAKDQIEAMKKSHYEEIRDLLANEGFGKKFGYQIIQLGCMKEDKPDEQGMTDSVCQENR